MPNWTSNVIKTNDPSIIPSFLTDEGDFDFNKLIPMPESLNVESGSRTDQAIAYYVTERFTIPVWQTNLNQLISNSFSRNWAYDVVERLKEGILIGRIKDLDELYELGKQYLFNKENYGCYTWYEWCSEHWGTKWNACDTGFDKADPTSVSFNTAWCAPEPIFRVMCNTFPAAEISFYCEDECGWVIECENKGGELVVTNKYQIPYEDEDEEDCDEE